MAWSPDIDPPPTWEELRSQLIPSSPHERWDTGELPRAILHLDDHAVLESCELLLRLTCVRRRCLQDARPSPAVALRTVLLELLPEQRDHPYCGVLRALAGLEPGTGGRKREERQRLAGDHLGPLRHPATPRAVRHRVKTDCWPWLLDRLIECEVEEREALRTGATRPRSAATYPLAVDADPGIGLWANASPDPDVVMLWLPVEMHGRLVLMPVGIPRRSLLKAGGAALLAPIAGLLGADHERVAAVVSGHSRPDMDSVEHFEALLAHFRKLDDLMGPRSVHGAVQSTARVLDGLCDNAELPVRRALLSMCAQYDQLDAWMWLDRGDGATAQSGCDRALARATEAGDLPLAGYLLTCKAEAVQERHPDTAIALAHEAQHHRWGLTPAVEALAARREAHVWAMSGKLHDCERKLEDAAALLAAGQQRRTEEPPWIYWFNAEYLPAQRGICYALLGRADAAIAAFDEAIANLPGAYVRDRAWFRFYSARSYADDNEPQQAAIVARDAVSALIDGGSDVLDEARKLHARLAHAQSLPEVREFGELLQTAGAQATATRTSEVGNSRDQM